MFVAGIEIFFGFVAGAILLVLGILAIRIGIAILGVALRAILRVISAIVRNSPLALTLGAIVWVVCIGLSEYASIDVSCVVGLMALLIFASALQWKPFRRKYIELNSKLFFGSSHPSRSDSPVGPTPS